MSKWLIIKLVPSKKQEQSELGTYQQQNQSELKEM